MSDTRNAFLAWSSSVSSIFAAVETRDLITMFSAIVLPVIFFTAGKTIDVLLQLYIKRSERRDRNDG